MNWPGYGKLRLRLRLRLRQKPYESRDVVTGVCAVTGVTGVTDVIVWYKFQIHSTISFLNISLQKFSLFY